MIDALMCLENFFKSNKPGIFINEYFNSNGHENLLHLLNDSDLILRELSMSIFGILMAQDISISEVP